MTAQQNVLPTKQTALEQIKLNTVVVADTGNLADIIRLKPQDATTNPSLITAAAKDPANAALVQQALNTAKSTYNNADAVYDHTIDLLTVALGSEILKHIQGRVSTEVDPNLSFDVNATVSKAQTLINLFKQQGVDASRVLIKIAATWQGIQAAQILESQGIHTNLTLVFGLHQAVACADANVKLISPFVGRILDWYKKAEQVESYPIEHDPGVLSVKAIYNYYKYYGISTEVMGASFRSAAQVKALNGCDLLTIAPKILDELTDDHSVVPVHLSLNTVQPAHKVELNQTTFENMHQQNPMATELLAAGIQGFIKSRNELINFLASL